MLNVVCVQVGNYCGRGAEYVNNLLDMVSRHMPTDMEWRFVCLTDDPTGLHENIHVIPCPNNVRGWWAKLYLFSPGILPAGRTLYFDLDTVIPGRLDDLANYGGQFAILRDFASGRGYGSGVMAWANGYGADIWQSWVDAGQPEVAGGDQAWIERVISRADILQDLYPRQIVSYKVDKSEEWAPDGARVVCFHGIPRPHQIDSGWVPQVWRRGGMGQIEFKTFCNTQKEQRQHNILASVLRGLPWLDFSKPQVSNGRVCIVGGGPSLKTQLGRIRYERLRGAKVVALNGAYDWLAERGIVADAHMLVDAKPENVRFFAKPSKSTAYWIASHCDPSIFDALAGQHVQLIHVYEPDLEDWYAHNVYHPSGRFQLLGGAGTVGLKAMFLLEALGYTRQHLFGMDSCYSGDTHHAFPQSMNDGETTLEMVVDGRRFRCAVWQARQAHDFREQVQVMALRGTSVSVHGDGLLTWIMECAQRRYDAKQQEEIA